ncbi:MAG: TolC family protein [Rikenellaceae bacterium]
MRRFIYILLLALCAQSVEAKTYTIEECRTMALETSKNLKSSSEKILAAEDLLSAYRSNYLPNFSLSASYLYSTSSFDAAISGGYLPIFTNGVYDPTSVAYMPDQNYELEIGSVYNAGLMAAQPIYMGGKVTNAIKLARVGVEVSKLEQRVSESSVIEQADNAFYKVIEVEELLLSAQKYQSVVEELHRQVERAEAQGMKSRNDVMKVAVKLNEAKLLTQKATNGVRLAKMNLCYTIGLPLMTTDFALQVSLEMDYRVDDSNLNISARPEYAMLGSQIEAKELEAKLTRGDFLPSVSAIASYGYTNGVKLNGNIMFNNAGFTGGVTMNIPIFHWGEGRRKTSAKKREITIAQNQMEDMSQLMTLELMQAINIYNESILEVQLSTSAVAQAEENMRLSKNQYIAGMETLADHLEAQAMWQNAMSELTISRSKNRIAYTQYLKCRGEL